MNIVYVDYQSYGILDMDVGLTWFTAVAVRPKP